MTKDMTQGSPLKLLLAFAVPLMLGSLFQQFYNLADTIIVGRFVGVDALAAVADELRNQQLGRSADGMGGDDDDDDDDADGGTHSGLNSLSSG